MDANYNVIMRQVLLSEGGNDDDPRDPGGRTSRGITQREYNAYRKRKGIATRDVWKADQSEVMDIYRSEYWVPMRCNELHGGIDYVVDDYGINSGIGRPPRVLQTILKLPVTGKMDAATIAAANKADPVKLINAVCAERLHYMQNIRGGKLWVTYRKGWTARVSTVKALSLKLAAGSPDVQAVKTEDKVAKATHVPSQTVRKATLGGTIGGGGGVAAISQQSGLPTSWVIAIAVAAAVIGIIVWVLHHRSIEAANNKVVLPPGMEPVA